MDNKKKLCRDTKNEVIGGVCSGLGDYLDIDPVVFRVLFAILFFVGGSSLVIYAILWIALPEKQGYDTRCNESFNTCEENSVYSSQGMSRNRHGGFVAGIILILAGLLFLLGNLIPRLNWHTYWPVLLIALGLILIIPFSSKKQ